MLNTGQGTNYAATLHRYITRNPPYVYLYVLSTKYIYGTQRYLSYHKTYRSKLCRLNDTIQRTISAILLSLDLNERKRPPLYKKDKDDAVSIIYYVQILGASPSPNQMRQCSSLENVAIEDSEGNLHRTFGQVVC